MEQDHREKGLLPLSLDERAARELARIKRERDAEDAMLRVRIIGGGCSGFQYQLGIDDRQREDDLVFESHGQRIVVDPVSYSLTKGSVITYVDDLMQSGFSVSNPNVVASCGCGSSFQVREDALPGA